MERCVLGAAYYTNFADFTLSSIYFYELPLIMAPTSPSIPAFKKSLKLPEAIVLFFFVLFILVFLLLCIMVVCVCMAVCICSFVCVCVYIYGLYVQLCVFP